ncbi:MAG: T9SS type A sorting domain-containing protein [Ferruginibacter sp.]|nr:T9SS type A sorting domain-containing protein [Ferruginibacter sp.]
MKLKTLITMFAFCCFFSNTKAQQQNDLFTQAEKYQFGIGVAKDPQKAFLLYLQSALGGNNKAMNRIAIFYNEGIGTVANTALAKEWFLKAGEAGNAKGFYNLANLYRNAKGSEQDFKKAYIYYTKAAAMNDPQSIYSKGYMLFKGFGCTQNYAVAMQCFKQTATPLQANSMYFLGLCYRNGFGIEANKDSATYWLQKALQQGNGMAFQELRTANPENSNADLTTFANTLKEKTIKTNTTTANKVEKITTFIDANIIEGKYKGYIIKYDWSNRYAISIIPLDVKLLYNNGTLSGTWYEENNNSIFFDATLTTNKIIFKNTKYKRTGHYNPTIELPYSFQNAAIQWQKINDSLTLSGTIQMFSEQTNEPQNPQYIYLTKYESTNNHNQIELLNDDGTPMKTISGLMVYPNPFTNIIKIDFENKAAQNVSISLFTTEGKLVYNNNLGMLQQGAYSITVQPTQTLAAGAYIVKMQFDNKTKSVQIIKQ